MRGGGHRKDVRRHPKSWVGAGGLFEQASTIKEGEKVLERHLHEWGHLLAGSAFFNIREVPRKGSLSEKARFSSLNSAI